MRETDLKNLCRKLKPVLGKRADALWLNYLAADSYGARQEADALVQLLANQYLSGNLVAEPILLPPPADAATHGEFLLGKRFRTSSDQTRLAMHIESCRKTFHRHSD